MLPPPSLQATQHMNGDNAFGILQKDHNLGSAPPEQRLKVTERTHPLDLPSTSASSAGKWMQQSELIGRKKGQDKSSERAQQGLGEIKLFSQLQALSSAAKPSARLLKPETPLQSWDERNTMGRFDAAILWP
ncbi:hypothetical protein AV530_002082 [Patagioenas fasciata monilis]|uniref:Uncharacterized protein n=1 Tax=Patagioenas fasciata monilis TaxID=372326 RepID=A0A1V4J6Z7_PATFA|nr:hypothetical protein AV530_002082 [Patagioenas fasciata monilis]